MRKFIGILALLLGVFFFLSRFAELQAIWAVIQRGRLVYIGLALLVEIFWIYNLSAFYQSVFQRVGDGRKSLAPDKTGDRRQLSHCSRTVRRIERDRHLYCRRKKKRPVNCQSNRRWGAVCMV
jgi:hypothetical protein